MSTEGTWACQQCTLENPSNQRRCSVCQARRPVSTPATNTSAVRAWAQRRRKRKRSPTIRVKVSVDGLQLEPALEARKMTPQRQEADTCSPQSQEPVSNNRSIDTNMRKTLHSSSTMNSDMQRSHEEERKADEQSMEFSESTAAMTTNDKAKKATGDLDCTLENQSATHDSNQVSEMPVEVTLPPGKSVENATANVRMNVLGAPQPASENDQEAVSSNKETDVGIDKDSLSSCTVAAGAELEEANQLETDVSQSLMPDEGCENIQEDNGVDANMECSLSLHCKDTQPVSKDAVSTNAPSQQRELSFNASNQHSTEFSLPEKNIDNTTITTNDSTAQDASSTRRDEKTQDIVNESESSQESADNGIGFSQLMTQEPNGFLYTQMSQVELDDVALVPRINSTDVDLESTGQEYSENLARDNVVNENASSNENHGSQQRTEKESPTKADKPPNDDYGVKIVLQQPLNEMANVRSLPPPSQKVNSGQTFSSDDCQPEPLCTSKSKEGHFPAAFKTAGRGSTITVSEESVVKASALLAESAKDAAAQASSTDSLAHSVPMFQTAGKGAVIRVTDGSLARANALMQDSSSLSAPADGKASSGTETSLPLVAASFQTAGKGTMISVTECGLRKATELLTSPKAADKGGQMSSSPRNPPLDGLQSMPTFQTAGSRRVISVSDASVARATSLLRETPVDAGIQDAKPSSHATVSAFSTSTVQTAESMVVLPRDEAQMNLFRTAGKGSKISVSEESLAKAGALFHSDSKLAPPRKHTSATGEEKLMTARHDESLMTSFRSGESVPKPATLPLVGTNSPSPSVRRNIRQPSALFQTAGKGNVISVSDDVLARADVLLDSNTNNGSERPIFSESETSAHSISVPMFQTAGRGTTIVAREESIARAASLSESIPSATNVAIDPPANEASKKGKSPDYQRHKFAQPTVSVEFPSATFQSAGRGTVIAPSDESMVRAAALFHDSSPAKDARRLDSSLPASGASTFGASFQTAGKGSAISVTEGALNKAGAMLSDRSPDHMLKTKPVGAPNRPETAAFFQTAGKGAEISVSEEGMARATTLLEGTKTTLLEPNVPSNCFQRSEAHRAPMSQTAGSGNTIAVSENSLAQACLLLQDEKKSSLNDEKVVTGKSSTREDKTLPASVSPSRPIPFQTAGKGSTISVTEGNIVNVEAILQHEKNDWKSPHPSVSSSAQEAVFLPMFQTAGKGSKIAVTEDNLTRATALLKDATESSSAQKAQASNSGVKGHNDESLRAPLSPTPGAKHAPVATFQTADHGVILSVTSESMDRARELLDAAGSGHGGTAQTSQPGHAVDGDAAPPETSSPPPGNNVVENHVDSNSPGEQSQHNGMETATQSQGLITQPVPPETPFVLNRRNDSETMEEESWRIRSVNFCHGQQSQPSCNDESRTSLDVSVPLEPLECADVPKGVLSAVTPSSRMATKTEQSYDSLQKLPAFTPKQTPLETANAVTMSFDPKNPYLRKREATPGETLTDKNTYSPVPINFRQGEGSFRGNDISPSSMKRSKKRVSWCEYKEETDAQPPERSTLSELASRYGEMESDYEVCLDAGVQSVTLAVDSNNATRVRFDCESGLPCSLFGQTCPPNCKPIGSVKDLRQSLVERGCEEKVLSDKWIANHFRWIVWKLASTERRFAFSLANSYLTYEHVIAQLCLRYDKELKGGNRSALRKVLNRDVAASNMMILCVSQLLRRGKPKASAEASSKHREWAVELTDGWYSIGCVMDSRLCAFIADVKIQVGSKLLVCNAKLEGPEDGIDPLDESYASFGRNCSAALCLNANGTRPASWDSKMGFVKPRLGCPRSQQGLLLVRSLAHVIPGGGNIPLINLVVCRLYPLMFLERKGTDNPNEMLEKLVGKSPVISEAQEYKNRMNFEKQRHQAMERLSETVQAECAKEVDVMAPELWKRLMASASPGDFYEQLSRSDQGIVDKWKDKRASLLRDMAQKEIEARLEDDTALFRESNPFIRAFVKSFRQDNSDGDKENMECEGAMLTIWNPTEQQLGLLREGSVVSLANLSVRSSKHEGLLQLTAGAKTQIEATLSAPIPQHALASIGYSTRSFVNFFRIHLLARKLSGGLLPSSPAPEVDTAGILLQVSREGNESIEERESIFMTDQTGLILRVDRDCSCEGGDVFSSLSSSARQNIESPRTAAFRDLRITHFDAANSCAVAVFAETSSVVSKPTGGFSLSLNKWAESPVGYVLLRRVAACMDAGIPRNQPSCNKTATAIGYIAGFNIPDSPGTNHSYLEISVDCGMPELQVWHFPFFLLDEALLLCQVAPEPVSLCQEEEEKYGNLKVLGKIFSARGLLLQFSLRKKLSNMADAKEEEEIYEVRQVTKANASALADVYVSAEEERHLIKMKRARRTKK